MTIISISVADRKLIFMFILFAGLIIFYGSLSQTQNREGQGR